MEIEVAELIQDALTKAALVDAKTAGAVGDASGSWWLGEVRAGRAPKPAIQQVRFTRWRLSDVLKFWRDFAAAGSADEARERALVKALNGSRLAQAKRQAAKAAGQSPA